MRRMMLIALLAQLAAACNGGGGTGDGSDGGDAGSVPGGPVVSALTSSAPTITDGESITFRAVVTDPDGQSDITLGRLEDTTGNVHYGDFAPSGGNEFTITIDWASIHQASAIEFTAPLARTFRAEFTDRAGHVGTRDLAIQLTCGADAACAGACTDISSAANHCGSCGHACPVIADIGGCEASTCKPTLSECSNTPLGITCDDICGGMGRTCVQGPCGSTAIDYGVQSDCESATSVNGSTSAACDQPLPDLFGVSRCCCTVP